ncbi:cytochrome P450, cyclodipeptide synthase-associated [Vibrio cidicii]|uniref:cytochrome P450, cyclodipeptide synthase-associated n=1 Tax=Vibrio cidicii TaxID=1763883 RepID=UPI003751863E
MSKLASLSLFNAQFTHDPYSFYERLHQDDLIYFDQENNSYFIGKFEDVERILKSPQFTTKPLMQRAEPVMGDRVLAQMEGEEHSMKRRMVMRGLAKDYFVNQYEPMIKKITRELLRPHLSTGVIDLVGDFGKDYAVLVTLGILGLPRENYREIAEWHKGVAEFITLFDQTESEKLHSLDCSQKLIKLISPLVECRREHPENDFLSLLSSPLQPELAMSTSEITALCLNILLAATEPADKTLAMMFKHLLSQPDAWNAVFEERQLIRDALEETLRLTSPVQLIPREVSERVTISGVDIPEGAIVYCMIGAANRDPAVFAKPNDFDLYRRRQGRYTNGSKSKHLAFGAGMHMCLGAAFSSMQLEVSANIILDLLPQPRMANPSSYCETGLYTRGPSSLVLHFTPHKECLVQPDSSDICTSEVEYGK